jgi:hypothetical protein
VLWSETFKVRNILESLSIDGRIILRSILGEESVYWIHLAQRHGNEPLDSIKGGECLVQLHDC